MPTHTTLLPIEATTKAVDALLTKLAATPTVGTDIPFRAATTRHGHNLLDATGPKVVAGALARIRAEASDKAMTAEREEVMTKARKGADERGCSVSMRPRGSITSAVVGARGIPRERDATAHDLAARPERRFGLVGIQRDGDRRRRHDQHDEADDRSGDPAAERPAYRLLRRIAPAWCGRQEGCGEAERCEHEHGSASLVRGQANDAAVSAFAALTEVRSDQGAAV